MLEFVRGDIFDIPADIRVNTVNCVGVMGAGVALAFKQRYPEMFKDYQEDCKNGRVRPGKMHVWKSLTGDWVINFPTKRDWREPSRYEDIDAGLDDLRSYLDSVGPVTVALPALGCGNGGLDWKRVSVMIREKLDGVNAHVYVFEPAASRRAGKNTTFATDEERRNAEQLGYNLFEQGHSGPVYVMGRPGILFRKWIALLPSRAPSAREIQALHAVAMELTESKADVPIALVYGTKVSEEIAELFLKQRVDTILLLPFGVLTRKALTKKIASNKSGAFTAASVVPAHAKWSPQLFAQTIDILRLNAAAVLLSDPEPNWLIGKGLNRWGRTPISYIRYETTPPSMREALDIAGAKPIGRRGDTGAPNIGQLVGPFRHAELSAPDIPDLAKNGSLDKTIGPAIERDGDNLPQGGGQMLTINLDEYSNEARQALFEAMLGMELRELAVTLPNESDRRRLINLGFSRNDG